MGRFMGSGSKKKLNMKVGEDVLTKMWNGVRLNNGIMVLLRILGLKTPITDADSLRALACKVKSLHEHLYWTVLSLNMAREFGLQQDSNPKHHSLKSGALKIP